MYTHEQIEQYIWDYIDGLTTTDEKHMVERLLKTDQQWMTVYNECMLFNEKIADADVIEQPSLRFTKNVMEEVAKYNIAPPAKSYINKRIIHGIAAFFVLSITGFVVYGISLIDLSAAGSAKTSGADMSRLNLNWSKYLNSTVLNIFLLMDVVVALLLLDQYLSRNKEKGVKA